MARSNLRPKPDPVKIFCGLIGQEKSIAKAIEHLASDFGETDCESPLMPFEFTGYYREEMGDHLLRKWLAFQRLRERGYLPVAKHLTLQIESRLTCGGRRIVNIDPGYVDEAQVVLATTKNFSHRIYIGMGYYAEVTLIYKHKVFRPLEWTYPDYKSPRGLQFFTKARAVYHAELRSGNEA
jgi:hypothetical protein